MSILSGYGKYKRYVLTEDGYKLCSQWTSSNTVHFDDGNTAQTKLGAIDGITDSLTSTSSNVALSANSGKSLQDQITQLNTQNIIKKSNLDGDLIEFDINSSYASMIAVKQGHVCTLSITGAFSIDDSTKNRKIGILKDPLFIPGNVVCAATRGSSGSGFTGFVCIIIDADGQILMTESESYNWLVGTNITYISNV